MAQQIHLTLIDIAERHGVSGVFGQFFGVSDDELVREIENVLYVDWIEEEDGTYRVVYGAVSGALFGALQFRFPFELTIDVQEEEVVDSYLELELFLESDFLEWFHLG